MNELEFFYHIEDVVQKRLSINETICVKAIPVQKNNDTILYALRFIKENKLDVPAPLVYLNGFYEDYRQGRSVESITKEIAQIYESNHLNLNRKFSLCYEDIQDKIFYKVVGTETNKKNFRERLYTDIGNGLSFVYEIQHLTEKNDVYASIKITHDLIHAYDYDVKKLKEVALHNTPYLFPQKITTLLDARYDRETAIDLTEKCKNQESAYVLSNMHNINGATVLFYPDLQKRLAEYMENNYYVLPSSVHEVIIMPEGNGMMAEEMEWMVRDVNRNHVKREDILLDKVLYYDREKEKLRLAMPDEPQLSKKEHVKER